MNIESISKVLREQFRANVWGRLERRHSDDSYWNPSLTPSGDVEIVVVGPWLWLKARLCYAGTVSDMTGDRDPYCADGLWDWIGPSKAAPPTPTSIAEIEGWSLVKARYWRENRDSGNWGDHDGCFVASLTPDGVVSLQHGSGAIENRPPEYTTTVLRLAG